MSRDERWHRRGSGPRVERPCSGSRAEPRPGSWPQGAQVAQSLPSLEGRWRSHHTDFPDSALGGDRAWTPVAGPGRLPSPPRGEGTGGHGAQAVGRGRGALGHKCMFQVLPGSFLGTKTESHLQEHISQDQQSPGTSVTLSDGSSSGPGNGQGPCFWRGPNTQSHVLRICLKAFQSSAPPAQLAPVLRVGEAVPGEKHVPRSADGRVAWRHPRPAWIPGYRRGPCFWSPRRPRAANSIWPPQPWAEECLLGYLWRVSLSGHLDASAFLPAQHGSEAGHVHGREGPGVSESLRYFNAPCLFFVCLFLGLNPRALNL